MPEALSRHRRGYDQSASAVRRGGNRLTGGGISSGLDEALQLIKLEFGEDVAKGVQRSTQYFPQPPVMGTLPPTAPRCDIHWD